jgi:hypothetical protein
MRIILQTVLLLLAPTIAFFFWAWAVKAVREKQMAGTLPKWQELPWTWLIIAGLVLVIASLLALYASGGAAL